MTGRIFLSSIAVALVAACAPATDRDSYEVGQTGVATFENRLGGAALYLGGCGHFDYEKLDGDEWVSQGGDVACVWEGLVQPVPPGSVVVDPIRAREPGTWRLRYPVGVGCSETAPLSEASWIAWPRSSGSDSMPSSFLSVSLIS